MGQAAVVIGASGGIGSALVTAIAASGRYALVHAASRKPLAGNDVVSSHIADVTDEDSIRRLAEAVGRQEPVGLVIVASGLLHHAEIRPEKALQAVDPQAMARVFAVNAIGPAIVAKHLVPLMPRRGRSVFAALSARVGSIGDNGLGGWYSYRASKAALNQVIRTLSIEMARQRPEAVALALHPGTVATPLSEPFRSGAGPSRVFAAAEAAGKLLDVIDTTTVDQSGAFLAWDGSKIPY
jgi:NAD(P)-dependent dehydrogenase (short-subunit alcohol dehydrogenase family)